MKVAVVANEGDSDEGYVGEALSSFGARFSRVVRDRPGELAGLAESADVVVLLGSDWSVHSHHNRTIIAAEQQLVHEAEARGIPILAICYGAQLVASALGCRVARTDRPEIGWRTIDTDDPALCPAGPWFEYHFDRWFDTNSVTSIARSTSGPQAFWHGRTLALQFHPEVSSDTIRRWLDHGLEEVSSIGEDAEAIVAEADQRAPEARLRCVELVGRFIEESASRASAQAH